MTKQKVLMLSISCFAFITLIWIIKTIVFPPIKVDHQGYIAHACGSINGVKYTNSLEALENCIKCNQFTIEIDLRQTTDNNLVAVHSWGQFIEMGDTIMRSKSFKNLKIMRKYSTLMASQIDSIWKANPNLVLVTDKTSDPDVLNKYFYDIRDRVIVEAFSPHDYFTLAEMGYKKVYYSGYLPFSEWMKAFWEYGKPINSYVTYYGNYFIARKGFLRRWFDDIFKCKYALYAVENKYKADSILQISPNVEYVYINEP